MRKFLFAAAMGLTALAATPAAAQAYQAPPPPPEGYYDTDYTGPDEYYRPEDGDKGNGYQESDAEPVDAQGYQQQAYSDRGGARRYRPGDYYEGGGTPLAGDPRGYGRSGRYYRPRRCGSTNTILGGVAGALLGGEIGRGNHRYSRRSGTGTVIGAGLGALVGSEIDRDNCEGRRVYRR
jgi:hypothetical protein